MLKIVGLLAKDTPKLLLRLSLVHCNLSRKIKSPLEFLICETQRHIIVATRSLANDEDKTSEGNSSSSNGLVEMRCDTMLSLHKFQYINLVSPYLYTVIEDTSPQPRTSAAIRVYLLQQKNSIINV